MNERRAERIYRSRRFIVISGIQIFSSLALIVGKLNGGEFVTITVTVLGCYSASRAVEHYVKKQPETRRVTDL